MKTVSLEGKKGLIFGIANSSSLAYGCAQAFRDLGAELAVTYRGPKAEPYVRPLARRAGSARSSCPATCASPASWRPCSGSVGERWGRLDFLLHSIAFAPKEDLHGRVVDCSQAGFALAMDVSCHSFIRMAKLAEPLMTAGGCLLTLTFYGSEKVVEHYNVMGPVKAALESVVRYMAAELAPKGIRVHAISPGPVKTRAASGIDRFDELLDRNAARRPSISMSRSRTSAPWRPSSWATGPRP